MKKFLIRLCGTGLFTGYLPLIPGTFGSFLGLVIYLLVRSSPAGYAAVTVFILIAGFLTAGKMERLAGIKDPKCVVIDEVAGLLIAFWGVYQDIRLVILGFVFFRLLDTFKPYPAWKFQHLEGAAGIMADDLVAGVYTNLVLQVIAFLSIPS